ncbi:uncharacterized protein SPPG_00879 [Spizellomyces punctatus DAOM BR117]|uniref:TmcB/TmcC TPR repeats domain-containing protein n=1 Tax=Spizellomyces punctatus (strain DAOM BR117) TaxID=645134 RepID=A0A0L0HPQ1_SPIPD|nr:uncharacterized protein SPPG_00879 [Spizellomyces punctatus DAOM BR117]KND03391.1 hypothetical protein SPPG_00879 [Spizellomyces punctatus DAOM BR117]|eukprot:XP_016611430.1 hypothetical protein SPPG_00879 [Spizellomyces punctatus DAOM BR117]
MSDSGLAEKDGRMYLGNAMEKVMFSVLYSMVKDNDVNNLLSYIIMFTEDIQLIAFAHNPSFYGRMPTWAQYVTNPLSYRPHEYGQYLILLGIVVGFVVVAIAAAAQVAVSFESGKFAGISLLALKTLRLVTKLLGTVLFMPFLEVLLVAVTCFGPDNSLIEYPSVQCFSGAYTAETVIAILLMIIFVPYNIVMSSIYLETTPNRKSAMARVPIGRVDTIYVVLRIILTSVFTLARDPRFSLAVLIPITAILSYLMIAYQPFYKSAVNQLRAGIFSAAFLSGIIAAISYAIGSDSIALPIVAVITVPIGFVVGVLACRSAFKSITSRVYRKLQLKQKMLPQMGKLAEEGGVRIIKTAAIGDSENSQSDWLENLQTITTLRTRPKDIRVFNNVPEVEIACRFVHNNRSDEALFIMDEIFAEGFRQYPKDAMLNLVYAEYLENYTPPGNEEPAYFIQKAKTLKPAFDARFFIFMQDHIIEQSKRTEGLNSSTLNISSYVEFQTMQNGARRNHLATLLEIRAFLTHVRTHQRGRDPKTYPIFLQRISEAEQKATDYYKKLISRWPKSKVLLRMYAAFLMQIKNDKEGAAKFTNAAEEIEELETRMATTSYRNESRRGSMAGSLRRSSLQHRSANTVYNSQTTVSRKASLRDRTRPLAMDPNISVVMEETMSKMMDGSEPTDAPIQDESNMDEPIVREIVFPEIENIEPETYLRRRYSNVDKTQVDDDDDDDEEVTKGVGFHGTFKEEDEIAEAAARADKMPAPSESVPSTRSSEREERKKAYHRAQLQSRLKAPVYILDRRQKLGLAIYLFIVITTIAVGIWSFQSAEDNISGFARVTRLSRAATLAVQNVRTFVQPAFVAPEGVPQLRTRFADAQTSIASLMRNFTTYYVSYLAGFYNDPATIAVTMSQLPISIKKIQYMNAYQLVKLVYQYGVELGQQSWNFYNTSQLEDNRVRFFLDNAIVVGPAFESASSGGQQKWINGTMQSVYVLYSLCGLLVVTMLGWAYVVLLPMMNQTSDEQIRTLKMFALLPKKPLMHMLTDVEEQIESIADEMTTTAGNKEDGKNNDEQQGNNGNFAARQLMNMTVDEDVVNKSPIKKHFIRYLAGLILLGLPATALLIVPIYRAMMSISYAATMNYTNSRRYLMQAVVMLAAECIYFDPTTWLPNAPIMWLDDRLTKLINLHHDSVTGVNCIATTTIPDLQTFTLTSAPCQPACGNLTIGLDAQIEWFINEATDFLNRVKVSNVTTSDSAFNFISTLSASLNTNLNKVDTIFQNIIISGNSVAKTAIIVLFAISVASTLLVYLASMRATAQARLQEMESTVTLLFAIPEPVVQSIPEIKKFVESGGMFTEEGARKRK